MNAAAMNAVVEVLLPLPFDHGFDYAVPEGMKLVAGDYVTVPFGRKEVVGVVWGEGLGGIEKKKLKSVLRPHAEFPPMAGSLRAFVDWAAQYTLSPRGMVLKMAIPVAEAFKGEKSGERNEPRNKSLEKSENKKSLSSQLLALRPSQQQAAATLNARLRRGFSVSVLDGVTGSGKTEVYFDAIAHAIAQQAQVVVLLPEIALSVQWLSRFEKRFGFAPQTWHSDVPKSRKKRTWRAVAKGEIPVLVGARSALFLPYRNLSLIIVDEEHDPSYKQEEGVLYHARDMAVARAQKEDIPVILVSATPSLETEYNISQGKYARIHLPDRHGEAVLPEVQLVDMRLESLDRGAFLSPALRQSLAETLAAGNQSLLFLNRRGYAPLLLCRACGHRFQCPHCSAWMVVHGKRAVGSKQLADNNNLLTADCHLPTANYLQCHHCGHVVSFPEQCPACQVEGKLHPVGPGVERVHEEAKALFPQARISVVASDEMDSYPRMQQMVQDIAERRVDIIIGTQMIAKGHHFPGLALVGVVDADLGLNGGDLRASERTYQLLHQLSGRAGREDTPGRVLLQSWQKEHPVMQALAASTRGDMGRGEFMALELSLREEAGLPPFGRLGAVIVEGPRAQAEQVCRTLARNAPQMDNVHTLGPAPAPMHLLRGRHRYRFLVKTGRKVNIQSVISRWLEGLNAPATVRVRADIDPLRFM